MEIKVGMYVRTTYGRIYKIEKVETKKVYYSCNQLELQWQDREFVYSKSGMECETAISKASHNIIDLIEEGDYVNGVMVESMNNSIKPKPIPQYKNECGEYIDFDESDINSIVTKEQFESMSYKIER